MKKGFSQPKVILRNCENLYGSSMNIKLKNSIFKAILSISNENNSKLLMGFKAILVEFVESRNKDFQAVYDYLRLKGVMVEKEVSENFICNFYNLFYHFMIPELNKIKQISIENVLMIKEANSIAFHNFQFVSNFSEVSVLFEKWVIMDSVLSNYISSN